nr:CapA family protein [Haladaptatus pallidirubidus]
MDRNQRAYLAAAGAVAVGGCTGKLTGSPSSGKTGTSDTRTAADDSDTTDAIDSTNSREHHETTIGFAGDTMVGRSLNQIYGEENVDPATIWGDFRPRLESLDGVFCNLECCLSKRGERFPDRVYYFRGDPDWAVPALRAGNIRFATLSNNHAMDFGAVALTDTIDVLEEKGIENAGTGETPASAWDPATFSVGDLDVAVVSFSDEYEAYAVTNDRPGTAWAETDSENSRTRRIVGNAIESAKSTNPDLLVVSLHWGKIGSSTPATGSFRSATGSSIEVRISFTVTARTSFRRSSSTMAVLFSTTPAISLTISESKAIWATTRAISSKLRSRTGSSRKYASFRSTSTTAFVPPPRTRRPGSVRRCANALNRSERRTSGMTPVSLFSYESVSSREST